MKRTNRTSVEDEVTDEERHGIRDFVDSEKQERAQCAEAEARVADCIRSRETPILVAAKEIIEAGYKALAVKRHPDHGGSQEGMVTLNEAVQLLRMRVSR